MTTTEPEQPEVPAADEVPVDPDDLVGEECEPEHDLVLLTFEEREVEEMERDE